MLFRSVQGLRLPGGVILHGARGLAARGEAKRGESVHDAAGDFARGEGGLIEFRLLLIMKFQLLKMLLKLWVHYIMAEKQDH